MTKTVNNSLISFDRPFAIAAFVIGLSYALIISGLGLLLGKEAAGPAGVALTSLATAVFKRFEGLRFQRAATTSIEMPTVGIWSLLLLALTFLGAELVFGVLAGLAIVGFPPDPEASTGEFVEFLLSPSLLLLIGARMLAYFLTGYCAARAITRLRYSQLLISGLLALICGHPHSGAIGRGIREVRDRTERVDKTRHICFRYILDNLSCGRFAWYEVRR